MNADDGAADEWKEEDWSGGTGFISLGMVPKTEESRRRSLLTEALMELLGSQNQAFH